MVNKTQGYLLMGRALSKFAKHMSKAPEEVETAPNTTGV